MVAVGLLLGPKEMDFTFFLVVDAIGWAKEFFCVVFINSSLTTRAMNTILIYPIYTLNSKGTGLRGCVTFGFQQTILLNSFGIHLHLPVQPW